MKKKIGLFLGLLLVTVSLIACTGESAGAKLPDGFELLTENRIRFTDVYITKEKSTGCLYIISVAANSSSGGNSVTQMLIEKNGVSVPYCEEGKRGG